MPQLQISKWLGKKGLLASSAEPLPSAWWRIDYQDKSWLCIKSTEGWVLQRWTPTQSPDLDWNSRQSTAGVTYLDRSALEVALEQQRFPTRRDALQALEAMLDLAGGTA